MKDHEIAEFVNVLTDVGRRFGQTQQLRECIAQVVLPVVRSHLGAKPFPAPGKWFPTTIVGQPMREVTPGKWEYASWPSEADHLYTAKEVCDLVETLLNDAVASVDGVLGSHLNERRVKDCIRSAFRNAMDGHRLECDKTTKTG